LYFNGRKENSDIILLEVEDHFGGPDHIESEWGFRWDQCDGTMGQVSEPVLKKPLIDTNYIPPDPFRSNRFESMENLKRKYGRDKYYIASFGLSGFTIMTFLRGFSQMLEDLILEREEAGIVADMVFGFEEKVIDLVSDLGIDGIGFFDDWGMQNSMIISPELWREFFLPRYRKQFERVHLAGLSVYFHSCGYYREIIPDLIESGVDFLNISQPNLYSIEELGVDFSDSVCFVCPVSYQTTSIKGSRKDIYREVKRII